MKYEKQEHIPHGYKWSIINDKLSNAEVDSYNRYTDDYNNAKSDEAKEFFLDQRNKYLKECFKSYEERKLNTLEPVNLQSSFNEEMGKFMLSIPGTADAIKMYGKEKPFLSNKIMVAKGENSHRFLFLEDNKIVSSIVVTLKNEQYGLKENMITTAYTDEEHRNKGYASKLVSSAQNAFKNKLVVSSDLTEAGVMLFKPKGFELEK
ncbi:GNAT family N-acetyltransferase [Aquitalea pelogenes]|uniref:GNAT family N-acetyltransferase n=1 Tax=Aquitalea pelogenes TaxID=1293573 RepID=UPI0035B01EE6